jgi:hypothetical protein
MTDTSVTHCTEVNPCEFEAEMVPVRKLEIREGEVKTDVHALSRVEAKCRGWEQERGVR